MIATASDGTLIHYVVEGSGPPVVLVGGKTSSIDGAWWRYLPALATHFRVIAFDNRGAGESGKPNVPYTTAMLAGDALAVLHSAGETSAHWVGISLGGMMVQQLALDHPDAVRSLILIATTCRGQRRAAVGAPTPELAATPLRRYAALYASAFILEHPDWVVEDAKHFGKMPLHAIHRQDQAAAGHDVCDRLREIRQPALIIHGRADRMIPAEAASELATGLPNAELRLLDGAGHQVHSERFDEVAALIGGFVERVERERR